MTLARCPWCGCRIWPLLQLTLEVDGKNYHGRCGIREMDRQIRALLVGIADTIETVVRKHRHEPAASMIGRKHRFEWPPYPLAPPCVKCGTPRDNPQHRLGPADVGWLPNGELARDVEEIAAAFAKLKNKVLP